MVIREKIYFQVEQWCHEAGGNISIIYTEKEPKGPPTPTDETNPFWTSISDAVSELYI